LLHIIKYETPAEREPAIKQLHVLCGQPELPNNLMMDSAEVRAQHHAGIGIGAHTVHHPILCSLSDEQAEQEIDQSRQRLQSLIGAPVPLFAYPNGKHGRDYDDRHAAICKRLGFSAAVATTNGVSRASGDLFHMRRFTPWQREPLRWSASLLAHHLRGCVRRPARRGSSRTTPQRLVVHQVLPLALLDCLHATGLRASHIHRTNVFLRPNQAGVERGAVH
jgi:Polysaccharide deacetylase